MRQVLKRTPRFAERVFTEAERAYCDRRGVAAPQHYAARFAAKEAALKALGTGWSGGMTWHDVEVVPQPSGAPRLAFRGLALEMLRRSGANAAHVSISHTAEHAVAQVILERTNDT